MSHFWLIKAVETEGFGGGAVIAAAFGDVQVADVFEGRDDGGSDGGQIGGPDAKCAEYLVPHFAISLYAEFSPAHATCETVAWRRAATLGTGELVFGSGVICAGYRCSSCGGSEPTATPPSAFSIASATPA